MFKKVWVCLIAAVTFAFLGFQLYTMYEMVFLTPTAAVSGEEDVVIRHGNADESRMSFTCNVDWGEAVLPDLLNVLDEYNIKVTFFISGKWAENNPWLLRRIFVTGHEIQSHGYAHRLCSKISKDEAMKEIEKTEESIHKLAGVETRIFAPPSGDYDAKTVELCREMGYLLSLWSVDTIDWQEGSSAEVIEERVLNKDLNGAIVLMHPKEETVRALPAIIREIRERGIEMVPLSELIGYPCL